MSRFVDELLKLSKSSSTPIGFHHSISEAKSPPMLLVVGLSGAKLDEAKIVSDVSASAGLIWGENSSTRIIGQTVKAIGDVPVGVFVKNMSADRIDELAKLGCDFVVFDINMPALILQKEEVGKFLMIEPSLDLGFAKGINSLDVDGVFISGKSENSFIDVEHIIACRRLVEIIEKPAIVDLPSSVTKAELTVLWQTGIVGLVASSQQSVKTLRELGKAIGELPEKTKSRRAKADVKLPHYGGSVSGEEDEEQEEI
ncbi:MAG: hypothetical protein JSW22_05375 [Chloroflexota bacterium]|nr:MAG: hypothetical protein JSW22_05375 [Chloroflexota bacterium]